MPIDNAFIQVQDITGNWITVGSTINQPQMVFRQLQTVGDTYAKLARAIDIHGNLIQVREFK